MNVFNEGLIETNQYEHIALTKKREDSLY